MLVLASMGETELSHKIFLRFTVCPFKVVEVKIEERNRLSYKFKVRASLFVIKYYFIVKISNIQAINLF